MIMAQNEEMVHTILLSASLEEPLVVHFEPVGGELTLAAGEHFRLLVHGPTDETLEIMHAPHSITVWPSPRLKVRVFDVSGAELSILGF